MEAGLEQCQETCQAKQEEALAEEREKSRLAIQEALLEERKSSEKLVDDLKVRNPEMRPPL